MPERKSIRVVAAVIKEHGRVFETARGYGEYKGWWEFPGENLDIGKKACVEAKEKSLAD